MLSMDSPALAKVLVAGSCSVGKSSLVYQYVFRGFVESEPTVGVDLAHKVCVGEAGPVKLSIWDLSGHARFRSLMPQFCSGAAGVVLVFDLTNPVSLKAAGDWLKLVRAAGDHAQPCAVVLVGNKADLSPKMALEVIDAFCHQHGIQHYVSCSAKTGENVGRVFQTLCSAMQRGVPALTGSQRVLQPGHVES